MRPHTAVLAALAAILALQAPAAAQSPGRSAAGESTRVAQPATPAWKHFRKPDDATLRKQLTPFSTR
jgi:hypothetical protein